MGTTLSVKVFGVEKIKRRLSQMQGSVPNAIAQGLYLVGNNIMTEAKKLTPVEWGTLKASGYVTLPEMHGGNLVTELGFGGPAAEYALIQHEHIEFHHPEGGQAKYLEEPFTKNSASIPRQVAALARAALELPFSVPPPTKSPVTATTPTQGPFPKIGKRSKRKK